MLFKLLNFFTPLLHPIGMIWAACLVGAAVLAKKKQRVAALALVAVALMISILGSGIPGKFLAGLERPYVRKSLDEVPVCDAVVLLGGGIAPSGADPLGFTFTDAGSRIITAVEVVRAGKAPVLVLGGGVYAAEGGQQSDTPLVRKWIEHWGIVTNEMINVGITHNTHDEAVNVKKLADERGWKRVILVTSAFHMRRTEAVFRTAGLDVVPVACDFNTVGRPKPGWSFNPFPRPEGISALYYYIHEQVGYLTYRARGWIKPQPANRGAGDTPNDQVLWGDNEN